MKTKLIMFAIAALVSTGAMAQDSKDRKNSKTETTNRSQNSKKDNAKESDEKNGPEAGTSETGEKSLASLTADWPQACRKAVEDLESKYGQPDLANEEVVVWKDKGNWEMMFVSKNESLKTLPAKYKDSMKLAANKKSAESADREQM